MKSQIPLPIGKSDKYTFENFIPGENKQVVDILEKNLIENKDGFFYLWGKSGTGKSHLLNAICVNAAQIGKKSTYLPLKEYKKLNPEILISMENQDIVCIDDIYNVETIPDWEKKLFNVFNQLQEKSNLLIVTSTVSPSGSKFKLQDLKSRLSSGIIYHLKDLNEQDRITVLKNRASQRGFELSNEVLDYLRNRVARDMHSLLSWLDKLDEASLVSKRKITVPLLRELLKN